MTIALVTFAVIAGLALGALAMMFLLDAETPAAEPATTTTTVRATTPTESRTPEFDIARAKHEVATEFVDRMIRRGEGTWVWELANLHSLFESMCDRYAEGGSPDDITSIKFHDGSNYEWQGEKDDKMLRIFTNQAVKACQEWEEAR